MPSVNDVIRITACQNLFDERVCNVFFYVVGLWTGNITWEDVLDVFRTDVIDKLVPFQTSDLAWDQLSVQNLTQENDWYDKDINAVGESASAALPPFVSLSVVLKRETKDTRNGRKAVAGFTEEFSDDGKPLLSGAQKNAIEGAFSTDLAADDQGGNAFTLSPIILGRAADGSYELGRYSKVGDAVAEKFGSQNSRKFGRGA